LHILKRLNYYQILFLKFFKWREITDRPWPKRAATVPMLNLSAFSCLYYIINISFFETKKQHSERCFFLQARVKRLDWNLLEAEILRWKRVMSQFVYV